MASELNKLILNNEIVLMRHDVRKARVHLVHKITRTIKTLRSGKGSKQPAEKDLVKADKLVEEIRTLKALVDDDITKALLVYVDDPEKVLSDVRKTLQERVLAKMFTTKIMETSITKFRRKYPNWVEDVPALLKNMKRKSKNKVNTKDKPGAWNVTNSGENNGKTTVSACAGSWSVSSSVKKSGSENGESRKVSGNESSKMSPRGGIVSKNGMKFSETEETDNGIQSMLVGKQTSKISPISRGGKVLKNIIKFSENQETDGDSVPNKILRLDSDSEPDMSEVDEVETFGKSKNIFDDSFKNKKKVDKKTDKHKRNGEDIFEDMFKSKKKKKKIGEDDDDSENRLKIKKKVDKATDKDEENEDNFEERFKGSIKVSDKKSGKKEEMKVVDPFFMTNDDNAYLTVVSSKEQAEALQNPTKLSNHRNDDEELYYGSSLTGGFKQTSHHEIRKSSFTNLSGGSGKRNGNFRNREFGSFSKGGGRNDDFKNREFGSSPSHALPRRERRKLMNADTKESMRVEDEKLHPSWEAKRRQSCPAIPQFSGKKIVFDD